MNRLNLLSLFLFLAATSAHSTNRCSDVFGTQLIQDVAGSYPYTPLFTDINMAQIPLKRVALKDFGLNKSHSVLMGYEVLRPRKPLFTNPKVIREYLGPDANRALQYDASKSMADITKSITRQFPPEISDQIINLVSSIIYDVKQRKYPYSFFTVFIRTEKSRAGFPNGHSHFSGDLTYAITPIGPNSEVDIKNRLSKSGSGIEESDYFSATDKDQIVVFGGVWHRTPSLRDAEQRLLFLVEFNP